VIVCLNNFWVTVIVSVRELEGVLECFKFVLKLLHSLGKQVVKGKKNIMVR